MDNQVSLIRFDRRAALYCGVIGALFIIMTALGIHGSSIAQWDEKVPERPPAERGWILGNTREIRSDEWLVTTPFSLSQFQERFPVANPAIGAHKDPLIIGLPVNHFSTIFRPQMWGWMFLGAERGFAFWWNVKVVGLALSTFLLLLLLTRNRFWLAVTGTVWVYFSGFTQWWFSQGIPEMITAINLLFLSMIYLFFVKNSRQAIISAGVVVLSAGWFCLNLYPPFQIPLAWLLFTLLSGFILENRLWPLLVARMRTRGVLFAGVAATLFVLLLLFYFDARETIEAVRNTVYPGQRLVSGGTMVLLKLFSGFTLAPLNERTFPAQWINASEASNFILLFPGILMAVAWALARRKNISPMVGILLIYLVLLSSWAVIGLPTLFAKFTLLNIVPPDRALLGIGYASIILVIIFLGNKNSTDNRETDPEPHDAAAIVGTLPVLLLLTYLSFRYKAVNPDYFPWRNLILMSGSFAIITWLLLARRQAQFCAAILIVLLPYYLVNPLSQGLGPLIDNPVYTAVAADTAIRPGAKWAAFGDNILANLIIATGAPVINGYKYTPDMNLYRVFDPADANSEIYNRYANISFMVLGPGRERLLFELINPDAFMVKLNPCSEQLQTAGAELFAFRYEPDAQIITCLESLQKFPNSHIYLYKRK